MEELPLEFDAIVIGTGMTGSIVAAALSRIGKAVLHIDENDFYGEEWASFNLDTIDTWLHSNSNQQEIPLPSNTQDLVQPGEKLITNDRNGRCSNIKQEWFCLSRDQNKEKETMAIGVSEFENEADLGIIKDKSLATDVTDSCGDLGIAADTEEIIEKEWSKERLKANYRKFNLDICPKMLYSRGLLVELLISSNIARYADFKSVSRVLTWRDNRLELVPCSRADVFATKDINVVQKRMLVKVLTLFLEHRANDAEFEGFENKTFLDYLKHRKLSEQLIHYILYAIAMGSDKTPFAEGVEACQRFLQSLGRYGNTPFIFPLYGSGELPQCFCRLCAVFGGVYHLKRHVDGYIVNSTNEAIAIVSGGQRLSAKQIVVSSAFCPKSFIEFSEKSPITRGIFITDRSLVESEKEAVTLLQFPPGSDGAECPVTLMEMGSSCQVSPAGLFVVHMTTEALDGPAALAAVQKALFSPERENTPRVLWSLTWAMSSGSDRPSSECPSNVKIISGPDAGLDFDGSIQQASKIFFDLCPEEDFLARAPDPDEIVLDAVDDHVENPVLDEEAKEFSVGKEEKKSDDLSGNENVSETDKSVNVVSPEKKDDLDV